MVFAPASFGEKSCHTMLNVDVSASAGFLQTNLERALCGDGGRTSRSRKIHQQMQEIISICTEASSNSFKCQRKDVKVNKSHTPGKTNQRNSGKAFWATTEEEEGSQGWVVDFSACPCCKNAWTVPGTTQLHLPNSSRDLASINSSSQSCLSRELLFQFVTLTNA